MNLPIEIWDQILRLLPTRDLFTCLLLNKTLNQTAIVLLYDNVIFTSVKQRDSFLEMKNRPFKTTQIHFGFEELVEDDDENLIDEGYHSRTSTNDSTLYYSTWKNYFISQHLAQLPSTVHTLGISRAQFLDLDFASLVARLEKILRLDASYSSIRAAGISAIPQTAVYLNLSGIFRLKRNDGELLVELVKRCTKLKKLVVKECMDITPTIVQKIRDVNPMLVIEM